MATRRWVGGTGAFTDAGGWSPAGVPGLGDTAALGANANVTVSATLTATVLLTDPTATLSVQASSQGSVKDAPAAGAVGLAAVGGGGALLGVGSVVLPRGFLIGPGLDGGVLLVGSPDPATPFLIQGTDAPFSIDSTVHVVGAVSVASSTAPNPNNTPRQVYLDGSVDVEPGAALVTSGDVFVLGSATIVGGTLDVSQRVPGVQQHPSGVGNVSFDGSGGTLVVRAGDTNTVAGFRAGDVIDIKGVSVSGTLSLSPTSGGYAVGTNTLAFTGPTAAGATYTATPDGTGGTLVTVSGPNAGRTPASQYIFGFAFSAATVTFGSNGHALLTAPNGTVTDVTGVPTLQFLDGTINERTGTPIDPLFYYARNPDVWAAYVNGGLNAQQHYDQFGWHEGRDPDALFSTRTYLAANPDVAAAGVNPALHYDRYGWSEGRDTGIPFSPEAYRAADPNIAASGIDPLVHYLEYGAAEGRYLFPGLNAGTIGDFDPGFYLSHNPDVAAALPAGITPASAALQHYLTYGWKEGRDPDAFFSTSLYLSRNPDVAAAGMDPLLHFEQSGWREGRSPGPGFDAAGYLAHNPDVAAAGIDPLQHYLQHGMAEGRSPG